MPTTDGLRERKKALTRERIADVAAGLFAARGYDDVAVLDVARAADVSEQTVYNHFPAKQDLVLDRAAQIRERYGRVVRERGSGTSPAQALRPLLAADVDLLARPDLSLIRGQFVVLCLSSPVLRRFALQFREQQAAVVADAILATDPHLPVLAVQAHAAALVFVAQGVADAIGRHVFALGSPSAPDLATAARHLRDEVDAAVDSLDAAYHSILTNVIGEPS